MVVAALGFVDRVGMGLTGVSGAVLGAGRMPLGAAGGAFHALFCKVGYFFVF